MKQQVGFQLCIGRDKGCLSSLLMLKMKTDHHGIGLGPVCWWHTQLPFILMVHAR